MVTVGWFFLTPATLPSGSIKALAIQAAAGDTNAVAGLRMQGANAVPALVTLLEYQEPFLRRLAWAWAPKLPRTLSDMVLARAGYLNAPRFRVTGAKALGLLGSQAEIAIPALLRRLHDPEPYIGTEAAAALGRIGKPAVPSLTHALSDRDPAVRHAAAYALGEIGPAAEAAIPNLIQALSDQDSSVRSSTAYSLTMIGFPAVGALSNIIDHADANARQAAVVEFIRFYSSIRGVVRPLNKMAKADDDASRARALEALGAIRAADDQTIQTFIEALRDPIVEVRLAGLKSLSLVPWRAEASISALCTCLSDSSPEVRQWSAKVLGAIGPSASPAREALQRCSQDVESSVRGAALEALAKIDPAFNPTRVDQRQ